MWHNSFLIDNHTFLRHEFATRSAVDCTCGNPTSQLLNYALRNYEEPRLGWLGFGPKPGCKRPKTHFGVSRLYLQLTNIMTVYSFLRCTLRWWCESGCKSLYQPYFLEWIEWASFNHLSQHIALFICSRICEHFVMQFSVLVQVNALYFLKLFVVGLAFKCDSISLIRYLHFQFDIFRELCLRT